MKQQLRQLRDQLKLPASSAMTELDGLALLDKIAEVANDRF
jgi:hypothetical protein